MQHAIGPGIAGVFTKYRHVEARTGMATDTDTQKTITLTDNDSGNSVTLPVLGGTIGPDVLDIRKL